MWHEKAGDLKVLDLRTGHRLIINNEWGHLRVNRGAEGIHSDDLISLGLSGLRDDILHHHLVLGNLRLFL